MHFFLKQFGWFNWNLNLRPSSDCHSKNAHLLLPYFNLQVRFVVASAMKRGQFVDSDSNTTTLAVSTQKIVAYSDSIDWRPKYFFKSLFLWGHCCCCQIGNKSIHKFKQFKLSYLTLHNTIMIWLNVSNYVMKIKPFSWLISLARLIRQLTSLLRHLVLVLRGNYLCQHSGDTQHGLDSKEVSSNTDCVEDKVKA